MILQLNRYLIFNGISDWSVHSSSYVFIELGRLWWIQIALGACRHDLNILIAVNTAEWHQIRHCHNNHLDVTLAHTEKIILCPGRCPRSQFSITFHAIQIKYGLPYCVTCPSMSTDPGSLNPGTRRSRVTGWWDPGIRTNTGAGDTVLAKHT